MNTKLATSEVEFIALTKSLIIGRDVPYTSQKKTKKIGPSCQKILEDTLRKGILSWIVRNGAWETRTFFTKSGPVRGPSWDRHPKIPLKFGPFSFQYLMWEREKDTPFPNKGRKKLQIGDEILLSLSKKTSAAAKISPLCWLLNLKELISESEDSTDFSSMIPSFDPLIKNHSWLLESLANCISRSWIETETSKNKIISVKEMRNLGRAQKEVMSSFLQSCDKLGRRDLSVIFTDAASWVLNLRSKEYPSSKYWIESLNIKDTSLSQRQEVFRESGGFLEGLSLIHDWAKEAGMTPHWEDEYKNAQTLLANWKPMIERPKSPYESISGFNRAARLVKSINEV